MRMWVRLLLFGALFGLTAIASACSPVNTVPAPVAPADPVQYYDLDLPSSLEIKSVDFDAAMFTNVSGSSDLVGSQVGGRGFLKVYAVDKKTGEQYLLIYENIRERKRPVQVIRFRAVPDDTLLRSRAPN
jgi:hypothetical protein